MIEISAGFQTVTITKDETIIVYNILGFNFLKRSFKHSNILDVKTFINAIIIKTNKTTFKYPIADNQLRESFVNFYKQLITFEQLNYKFQEITP
jgi:hypothetical protein